MLISVPEMMSKAATGIGSLPDIGEERALSLIQESFPLCPHWPQFPTKAEEYFDLQVLYLLKGLEIIKKEEGKNPRFLDQGVDFLDRAALFYELYLSNVDSQKLDERLAMPESSAVGFYYFINQLEKKGVGRAICLKGQAAAPLTVGMQVLDAEGASSFFNEQLRDIVVKALELHVIWQVRELKKLGLPVIIFLDEGMMQAYGNKQFLSLRGDWIIDSFRSIIDAIKREGAAAGIHACCIADWSVLLASEPDIINLDAYNYFTSLLTVRDELNEFLKKGGYIAWGIVPVNDILYQETADSLLKRLNEILKKLINRGVEESLLYKQMIITPCCGTGLYLRENAERAYSLTAEISGRMK
ncbi:uroporphyrinogen decarboxylase/cobalamine-independent methonine synthase family protein [Candidatus Contubernalis alkaliaceticus]|uniref:hypothetical protein n=1 Tax=Candidatus Contubernalis alkaliaceticus TaxID=338645 RepID=UPI001F4C1AE7|nr:hypothetical protein [Candidatus Contubernalis alkalaceticus]UNC90667.1 hypothetical protein HUE98_00360 [Candidatus Contubernalis alkalaceticus]